MLAGLAVAPVAAAGEQTHRTQQTWRREPVSVTPVADHGAAQVRTFLTEQHVAAGPVRYGIRAYRLTYRTVDPYGKPTTATGLLTLPKGGAHRLDLVSDTHGTMVHRNDAPSASEDYGRIPSYLNASAGRAVAALYDGNHEEEDVVKGLAPTVQDLLTPAFQERLRHPSGALLDAMRAADHTCDWKPDVPVRLYAGRNDTDVPIGNARTCARTLADHGARVRVVDQGAVDHVGSALVSEPQVVRFFDRVADQYQPLACQNAQAAVGLP